MTKLLFLFIVVIQSALAGVESIPYPYYFESPDNQNSIMNLSRGEESFKARVDIIRGAKKHIEVEYYIFGRDLSGKILLNELMEAARRGVKVRILLDKLMSLSAISSYYAQELLKAGVTVKYYNNSSLAALSSVQYRSHRKLLSADDEVAITGGRNIGDEYFNLSTHLNYDDRDALVKGPVVKTMRETFDGYYEDRISEAPKLQKKTNPKQIKKAQDFFILSEKEEEIKEKILSIGDRQLSEKTLHGCPLMTFASDSPGGTYKRSGKDYAKKHRFLGDVLDHKVSQVDKSLMISSPYFITNKRSRKVLNTLLKNKVSINVHTNSLGSTDAIYMSANLYLHLRGWVKKGIQFHLHDGEWSEDESYDNRINFSKRWGTHAKTQIYETSQYTEVMIGTFNLDNRSYDYNTEMAVFCKGNDDFTQEVKDDMIMKSKNGIEVKKDGSARDRFGFKKNVTGAKTDDVVKMNLITFPSWLVDFLL